jgi:hypothetical protein
MCELVLVVVKLLHACGSHLPCAKGCETQKACVSYTVHCILFSVYVGRTQGGGSLSLVGRLNLSL